MNVCFFKFAPIKPIIPKDVRIRQWTSTLFAPEPFLLKRVKNLLAITGIILAGHQAALAPHALCQSVEAITGDPVELAAEEDNAHCHQAPGLAAQQDDHGHDHCDHQLPDSRESLLEHVEPATFTNAGVNFGSAPAASTFLIATSRNVASSASTDQFTRHVRILS